MAAAEYVRHLHKYLHFWCGQTDLVVAAGRKLEKVIKLKKGQFMSPESIEARGTKKYLTPRRLNKFLITR